MLSGSIKFRARIIVFGWMFINGFADVHTCKENKSMRLRLVQVTITFVVQSSHAYVSENLVGFSYVSKFDSGCGTALVFIWMVDLG